MDFREIMFGLAPAVRIIYKDFGFIPTEEDFSELTQELYTSYAAQGGDISKRLYSVAPKGDRALLPENEIGLLTEEDVPRLLKAANLINRYATDRGCHSDNDDEILLTAAQLLPEYFSEGTKYNSIMNNA